MDGRNAPEKTIIRLMTAEELYKQDQADRRKIDWAKATNKEHDQLWKKDEQRKETAKSLLKTGAIKKAVDYRYLALVFQHGTGPEDFKTAHELAKKALDMGDNLAKWLYAATLDRYLLSTNKPQKFGTQFIKDKNGNWQLALPIDPKITDEERAKYGVPPLSQALQKYKEKYHIE